MNKFLFFSLLPALLLGCLSFMFVACGGDEDSGGSSGSSQDYIELTVNGKPYKKTVNLYGLSDNFGRDADGNRLSYTYLIEDIFTNEDFDFGYGLLHFSNKEMLLASKSGTFACEDYNKSWNRNKPSSNLTFYPQFEPEDDVCRMASGTHQVTSITQVGSKVRVIGKFTAVFEGDETYQLKGQYQITIPE